MTIDEAKRLGYGAIIYDRIGRNADGTPHRWRVNGAPKTWKRDAGRVEVPIKRGLRSYARLTADDLSRFCLTEREALGAD